MNSQVQQTIEMITPDGNVSTAIISNANGGTDNENKNLVIDHVYGLVASPSTSAASASNMLASSTPPPGPPMKGRSKVWNEFTVTPDGKKVTCRRCGDSLAYSNSHSTSSMLKHLKRKHSLDLYPPANGNDDSDTSGGGGGGIDASNGDRFRSPMTSDKRSKTGASSKSGKKPLPKDAEELDTSIQHGPLPFQDPCVRMKWTDHSDTFLRTFSSLYSDESYTDVTLVVEKHFFKAHRVILSSASEFFDESFRMTPAGQHPIIFLKDVKAMDLRILLDFIYKGEVSIPPSLIPGLVKVGSDLRVRGLSDFAWKDQLSSCGFQSRPPPPPQPQQQQHAPAEQTFSNTTENSSRFIQQPAQQQTMNSNSISSQSTSSLITPTKLLQPVRTLIRQPAQQLVATQQQSSEFTPRTYSRIVNIRPTNPSLGIPSNELQGQLISGDLGAVCSTVANTFPSMKRIRIVTSEPRLSPAQQIRQVVTGIKGGGGVLQGGQTSSSTLTSGGGGGVSSSQEPETVLMVTNEGETLLSTTQGGVTVLTPPNTAMTLPTISGNEAQQQHLQQSVIQHEQHQQQQQLHPVITAITSQSQQHHQQRDTTEEGTGQDLGEVVYSIAKISEEGGDTHEVLMHQGKGEMVCEDSEEEPVDKKPFLPT